MYPCVRPKCLFSEERSKIYETILTYTQTSVETFPKPNFSSVEVK